MFHGFSFLKENSLTFASSRSSIPRPAVIRKFYEVIRWLDIANIYRETAKAIRADVNGDLIPETWIFQPSKMGVSSA
jgi:hypothetical protein